MKKIKNIQIVQHLNPGGLEIMALNLLNSSPQKENSIIISLEGCKNHALKTWPRLQSNKSSLIFLNKKRGLCLRSFLKLIWIILRYRPNVIHTHHIGPLLYGGLVGKFLKIKKIIHTEHDAWYLNNNKNKILQNLLIKIIKPKVVAVSKYVANQLNNKCSSLNLSIIPNGIDIQNFKPFPKKLSRKLLNISESHIIVGSAGRLVEVKGHRYLIESLTHFDSNVKLVIAGDGELKSELQQLVTTLNLEKRVHFLGHIDDMNLFYNAIDIFCLPSLNEGLPLSLLEAQACNTPCIASNVGGCHEVITKQSGALSKIKNSLHLYQTIQSTISKLTSFQPRKFVLQYGDLNKMTTSYEKIYQENT